MKNIIYLLIVSSGMLSVIALYLHLVGFSKRVKLSDREQAVDLMQSLNPGKTISNLMIPTNMSVALALFSDGTGSLLHAMGDKWVAHDLVDNSLKHMKISKDDNLRLAFPDFTTSPMTLRIGEGETAKLWQSALQPFMRGYEKAANSTIANRV